MGFAANYLQKHAVGDAIIAANPDKNLNLIIAIPAYNESGLTKCLDSLFLCNPPKKPCEVIVLINSGENTPEEIIQRNKQTYHDALEWIEAHSLEHIYFHVVTVLNLPKKHFGVGLARKILMDEAVRRFDALDHPQGILASLDADTKVDSDYLVEIESYFEENKRIEGCSIRFEHPIEGSEFSPEIYEAVINYEIHQRYYLQSLRYTGYPYAHHTVGSCFALRANSYCKHGGMSKRQAGEDFYFIQKVAMHGRYADCNSTKVLPSPRPSDRVPFGTGPDIAKQLLDPGQPYLTFNPDLFIQLKDFYDLLSAFYSTKKAEAVYEKLDPILQSYLLESAFAEQVQEIKDNVASYRKFKERFFQRFNMFRMLKYFHFAEEHGVKKMEIVEASKKMLSLLGDAFEGEDKKELLLKLRERESLA